MKLADGETTNNGNEKEKPSANLNILHALQLILRKFILESYEQFLKSYEQFLKSYEQLMNNL